MLINQPSSFVLVVNVVTLDYLGIFRTKSLTMTTVFFQQLF